MTRRWTTLIIILCCTLLLSACGDRVYLERTDIILTLGIDLNEKNQITFYAVIPTFDEAVKEQENDFKVTAQSLQEATLLFDALSQGKIVKGKIETILIGKKFLQNKNVIPYLDSIFRDPKNDLNSRVVMVDGSVEDILQLKNKKGNISVTIYNMIEKINDIGIASPNLQQFAAMNIDQRVTPTLPVLKVVNQQLKITGEALLDKNGKYISSLNLKESALLLCLQYIFREQFPITISLNSNADQLPSKDLKKVSIRVTNNHQKIKTTVNHNRFHFDVWLTLYVSIVERTFPVELNTNLPQVTPLLERQFNHDLEKLTMKLQKLGVDPAGFGIHAKVQQYDQWKKVQDNWPATFSQATVNFDTNFIIRNIGNYH